MFKVWSEDSDPGAKQLIMAARACFEVNASLSMSVSFDCRYGTCRLSPSIALMHSFSARSDVFISELSVRL